jgi:hypothetical protein
MAQDYDVTLKVLLRNFPEDFARVVFKNAAAKIELLNLELPATKHYTDALLKMTVSGETFILHVEFLSSRLGSKPNIPALEFMASFCILTRKTATSHFRIFTRAGFWASCALITSSM